MVLDADDMTTRLRAELPGALRGGQVIGYFQPEILMLRQALVQHRAWVDAEHDPTAHRPVRPAAPRP